MIAYSQRTVQEVVDEILSRVSQFETSANLDGKTVFRFLQSSRKWAFTRLMAFKDYAFVLTANLGNLSQLPIDYAEMLRVRTKPAAASEYIAARRIHAREIGEITFAAGNRQVSATDIAPAFMVCGNGNDADQFACLHLYPPDHTAIVEYYAVPADLPVDANGDFIGTATVDIPAEFEEFVKEQVLLDCYVAIRQQDMVTETFKKLVQMRDGVKRSFAAKLAADRQNIQSLLNAEPSATPSVSNMPKAQ